MQRRAAGRIQPDRSACFTGGDSAARRLYQGSLRELFLVTAKNMRSSGHESAQTSQLLKMLCVRPVVA
jgi:hypothetical protein